MNDTPEKDELSGVETTGHQWDGIKELNNPLPKWWVWSFAACVVWAIGYWIVMPAIPFPGGDGWSYTKGLIGYSQRDKVMGEMAEIEASRSVYRDQIAELPFADILADPELAQVAEASGAAIFGDNCAPCHGSGGQGFLGFPNLNDDDWLWGGTLEDIQQTITHGVRWDEDEDTRYGDMPRFLIDELLVESDVADVAEFILSLSQRSQDSFAVQRGATVFEDNCSSCHGEEAQGDREQGAPDLTDAIWLYGDAPEVIRQTISAGRRGTMPAWAGRLDAAEIKEVAIYVHTRGVGE